MSKRWPPTLGITGFDGGVKPAVALVVEHHNRIEAPAEVPADCGGCVCIDTVEITDAGSGNGVGNRMGPLYGTVCREINPFQLLITGVNGLGAVTSFLIIPGAGYLVPPPNPIEFLGGLGAPIYANCTFVCATPTLPCPDNILIEFSGVAFDCGCVATSSETSAIFTDTAFNGNPTALTRVTPAGTIDCGNSCLWFLGTCSISTLTTHYRFWRTGTICEGDIDSEGDNEQCSILFWLKDGVYTLVVISTFLKGFPIFYGTTTDITLPIYNLITDCSDSIAHGGFATIT